MNYLDLNMHLGLKIKQCRNSLGITQERLAEIIDISQSYLGQIERGAHGINIENLTKIATPSTSPLITSCRTTSLRTKMIWT